MGIDNETFKLLVRLPSYGVNFEEICTLGRQKNYISPRLLKKIARKEEKKFNYKESYIAKFLEELGARKVSALDMSAYEGAEILHDLNTPIPHNLQNKFSLLLDSGTLEHVHDVRTSFQNVRDLVKLGGHIFIASPANDWLGHGFYQFGPELFYREFSESNGFRIVYVYLVIKSLTRVKVYAIPDPALANGRMFVQKRGRITIVVLAEKIGSSAADNFQQSDYVTIWNQSANTKKMINKIYKLLPTQIQFLVDTKLRQEYYIWLNTRKLKRV